jgi:hypothetical protein
MLDLGAASEAGVEKEAWRVARMLGISGTRDTRENWSAEGTRPGRVIGREVEMRCTPYLQAWSTQDGESDLLDGLAAARGWVTVGKAWPAERVIAGAESSWGVGRSKAETVRMGLAVGLGEHGATITLREEWFLEDGGVMRTLERSRLGQPERLPPGPNIPDGGETGQAAARRPASGSSWQVAVLFVDCNEVSIETPRVWRDRGVNCRTLAGRGCAAAAVCRLDLLSGAVAARCCPRCIRTSPGYSPGLSLVGRGRPRHFKTPKVRQCTHPHMKHTVPSFTSEETIVGEQNDVSQVHDGRQGNQQGS